VRVSNNKDNIDWKNVIKKEVIGTDGLDLGEVVEIGDNFIVIQKGLFNKRRFVIPKSTAESFDGDILRVKVNEKELAGYEETADPAFKDYSKFKSSDMSKEMETRIPVIGENLQVSKKVVEDKVDIIKEPVKETKTVEIDLTYEKVTIERIPFNSEETAIEKSPDQNQGLGGSDIERPASSQTQSLPDQNQGLGGSDIERPVSSRTQISIPLKREVPVVNKNPYIREEVVIRKKPVKETKIITSDVTNEEVTFENKSNRDLT
jgi:stress response protein YsnF